nr:cytochrome c oxidase assembly factor Coa1 family protein [uncultured Allomuricauda sp.]
MDNELVTQPSWWKKNWKWVVPVGGCLTLIIICIVFFATLFFGATKLMEDSQPYEYAFELINNDEQLINLLGKPIEKDGMVQGSINWHNGQKKAELVIPIAGPKDSGTLYIDAYGEGDTWNYREIRVEIHNTSVNLLE